jgi:hypothetical protein
MGALAISVYNYLSFIQISQEGMSAILSVVGADCASISLVA